MDTMRVQTEFEFLAFKRRRDSSPPQPCLPTPLILWVNSSEHVPSFVCLSHFEFGSFHLRRLGGGGEGEFTFLDQGREAMPSCLY